MNEVPKAEICARLELANNRGIRTLDFSIKTTNAVLSDLQIVDEIKYFYKKLQIRSA